MKAKPGTPSPLRSHPLPRDGGCLGSRRVLAEQAAIEGACLAVRFEPEPAVQLLAESFVAVDDCVAQTECRLGAHGESLRGFVVCVELDRTFRSGERARRVAVGEPQFAELVQE